MNEDYKEQVKHERHRAEVAEALNRELQEQAEQATTYAVRTDSGEVVYEGAEGHAINVARKHFARTREHCTIDGSDWNTRKRGTTRIAKRPR